MLFLIGKVQSSTKLLCDCISFGSSKMILGVVQTILCKFPIISNKSYSSLICGQSLSLFRIRNSTIARNFNDLNVQVKKCIKSFMVASCSFLFRPGRSTKVLFKFSISVCKSEDILYVL